MTSEYRHRILRQAVSDVLYVIRFGASFWPFRQIFVQMQQAGYSGTPLEKKLGIKPGFSIRLVDAPDHYFRLFSHLPAGLIESDDINVKKDFIHYFTKSSAVLGKDIGQLRHEIKEDGMIWISWPKKASKVETDLSEDVIRDLALSNGLVDVKVCAVDEVWSGLKLVVRVKDRKKIAQ